MQECFWLCDGHSRVAWMLYFLSCYERSEVLISAGAKRVSFPASCAGFFMRDACVSRDNPTSQK